MVVEEGVHQKDVPRAGVPRKVVYQEVVHQEVVPQKDLPTVVVDALLVVVQDQQVVKRIWYCMFSSSSFVKK